MTMQHIRQVYESDESLTSGERLVLIALCFHANSAGTSWPSQTTLARESGLSDRAVRRAMSGLQDKGLVEATGWMNRCRVWTIMLDRTEPRHRTPASGYDVVAHRTPASEVTTDDIGQQRPDSPENTTPAIFGRHRTLASATPDAGVLHNHQNHHTQSSTIDSEYQHSCPTYGDSESSVPREAHDDFTEDEREQHQQFVADMRKAIGETHRPTVARSAPPKEDLTELKAIMARDRPSIGSELRDGLRHTRPRNSGRVVKVDFNQHHAPSLTNRIDRGEDQ